MRRSVTLLPWDPQINRQWRALLHLRGRVSLPQLFTLNDSACTSREIGTDPSGRCIVLVESTYVSEDVEAAYYQALDSAEELADRLALLGLAAIEVSVVSVTYPEVQVGSAFEIAVAVGDAMRSQVTVAPEDLSQFERPRSDVQARALRLFRTGVSSPSPYHALGQLWAAAEVLARECAERDGCRVEYSCRECGAVQKGQPRTQPYIEGYFEPVLDDKSPDAPSRTAARVRDARGKVIHGGKLQDRVLREEVDGQLGYLHVGVAAAISRAMGVTCAIRKAARIDAPVMFAQIVAQQDMCVRDNATILANMHFGKWAVGTRGALPSIPKDCGREQEHTIGIAGLAFPMILPNEWLPMVFACTSESAG